MSSRFYETYTYIHLHSLLPTASPSPLYLY